MKNIILIIGALLFSTFFYKQDIGLNLLLFTLLTITILAITNFSSFNNRKVLFNVVTYLITGIGIFLHNSNLVIIANIISFITLVGSISEYKSSIYIKWLNGLYTTIVAAFSHYFDSLTSEIENVQKKKIDILYWSKIIGIPVVIIIIFISLYRNGNPLFDGIISKIDLSFINLQWILLAAMGYYLFYNITHPIVIEPVTINDISTGNTLEKNSLKNTSEKKLESEKQLGTVLLVSLNILILFFLATDIYSLVNSHQLRANELSVQVHNGINALIASIILAIVIINYFFRGNLNFVKGNKTLKNLTYLWIVLNVFLMFITSFTNYQYVHVFGLTYKRIGVFVYLFLTFIGLITTFIKVNKIQNIWFLFRKNSQLAFFILIISSTLNWDNIITNYNVKYAKQTDVEYLINLTNNNTFLLKRYFPIRKTSNYIENQVDKKHTNYIIQLKNNSWQEMTYDNLKIK